MGRSIPLPGLLFALVPVVLYGFTFYFANWFWTELAAGLSGKLQYWFMRAAPAPVLLLGPLVALMTVYVLPLHRRRPVAMVSLLCFLPVVGIYTLREINRLSPFVESGALQWDQALSFLDMVSVVCAAIGFIVSAVSVRISSVVPETVKRARRGIFGDADWLPMSATAQLFPADGEIVVGERYRVDKEPIHALPFNPVDPSTWGRGGKAPLLTYNQNFDSTHMLFFADQADLKRPVMSYQLHLSIVVRSFAWTHHPKLHRW